ncbi:hypothetical protein FB446DRAFT_773788, partial [Lentinula raphanica]
MPRITRAQQLAESEAARRMYALNQTRDAGQAGGSSADFQSNQGQARRQRSEEDPGDGARLPSPFLDPEPGIGRNSMGFNPPPRERGRESGGVPEEVPPSSDEDDSDYSPGHTHRSQSSVSNVSHCKGVPHLLEPSRLMCSSQGRVFPDLLFGLPGLYISPVFPDDYESEFDDRDFDFTLDEESDPEAWGRGRRGRQRDNRKAVDQRRFLESDNSSDEDYVPSRSPSRRSASAHPVGSRTSHHRTPFGSQASRHSSRHVSRSVSPPASRSVSPPASRSVSPRAS